MCLPLSYTFNRSVVMILECQNLCFFQHASAVIALGAIFVASGGMLPEVGGDLGVVNDKGRKGRAEAGFKQIQ